MSALRLTGITKRYGSQTVVNGLDLAVGAGEFVSLLGPSGCGKTTLLRIIAGLTACDSGRIVLADSDVTALPAHQRNIGVVFQSYALFAHLSVGENISFGLKARGAPKAEIAKGVAAALESVQLSALAGRPISALSGGEQQRGAGGLGCGARAAAASAARAAVSAGPQTARGHADRTAPDAARRRHDGHLRDARSAGSAGHVRPHRRHE